MHKTRKNAHLILPQNYSTYLGKLNTRTSIISKCFTVNAVWSSSGIFAWHVHGRRKNDCCSLVWWRLGQGLRRL